MKKIWYLTLVLIIIGLSFYYVTMPNELLSGLVDTNPVVEDEVKDVIEEANSLTTLRVNLQEERQEMLEVLNSELSSSEVTAEEKNNAYEKLKYLNEVQSLEEGLEKEIKDENNLDCFVKVDNSNVNSVCISSEHDKSLANKLMRLIQSKFDDKVYVTVKFQKS